MHWLKSCFAFIRTALDQASTLTLTPSVDFSASSSQLYNHCHCQSYSSSREGDGSGESTQSLSLRVAGWRAPGLPRPREPILGELIYWMGISRFRIHLNKHYKQDVGQSATMVIVSEFSIFIISCFELTILQTPTT